MHEFTMKRRTWSEILSSMTKSMIMTSWMNGTRDRNHTINKRTLVNSMRKVKIWKEDNNTKLKSKAGCHQLQKSNFMSLTGKVQRSKTYLSSMEFFPNASKLSSIKNTYTGRKYTHAWERLIWGLPTRGSYSTQERLLSSIMASI